MTTYSMVRKVQHELITDFLHERECIQHNK
jgi:hypothetical protein